MNHMTEPMKMITANTMWMSMVVIAIMSMMMFRKQLLIILISLEMISLLMFMMLITFILTSIQPLMVCFYMLIMSACEAALALTLTVTMTRKKGSDMLSTISKFKF